MTDFAQKLGKISDFDRKILQSLTLIWEPMLASDIQKLLKLLGFRTTDGKIYTVQQVSQARNSLIDKGLLYHFRENWGRVIRFTTIGTRNF